jgi:hypothetical protein
MTILDKLENVSPIWQLNAYLTILAFHFNLQHFDHFNNYLHDLHHLGPKSLQSLASSRSVSTDMTALVQPISLGLWVNVGLPIIQVQTFHVDSSLLKKSLRYYQAMDTSPSCDRMLVQGQKN